MISDSPQSYFLGAPLGTRQEVLKNAIDQARAVERRGLTAVLTLGHLSHLTGVHYLLLRDMVARQSDPYDEFSIRRDGGRLPRVISSPQGSARRVQSWILRKILNLAQPHSQSFAYEPGKSIAKCAQQHVGARWMLKVDLHDFFHAIDESQVFRTFIGLGYQPLVSFEMARICTRQAKPGFPHFAKYQHIHSDKEYEAIPQYGAWALGFLPQGSPTSGALANLVSFGMDSDLQRLAVERQVTYTRYADDMTFSSTSDFTRGGALTLLRMVGQIVGEHGFELHEKKTRIISPGARKVVLGLLVDDDKVRLTRAMRRRIDEHLRGARKFGCRAHAEQRNFQDVLGFIRHLTGLLNFASDVDADWTRERRRTWEDVLSDQNFRPSSLYWQ